MAAGGRVVGRVSLLVDRVKLKINQNVYTKSYFSTRKHALKTCLTSFHFFYPSVAFYREMSTRHFPFYSVVSPLHQIKYFFSCNWPKLLVNLSVSKRK